MTLSTSERATQCLTAPLNKELLLQVLILQSRQSYNGWRPSMRRTGWEFLRARIKCSVHRTALDE
ncbi:hypothetical protein A9K55_001302 [Cordyceps militaris]|uniref:Uncharacterized protein n=1 Tax=Cordyceps militaris TaxID=73501 RepID=A0A2H4SR71_CORMI|nr:hypothetical protein A9K55_001302 [Cordyceps militaris]